MLLFKVFDLLFKRTIETSTDTIFLVFLSKFVPRIILLLKFKTMTDFSTADLKFTNKSDFTSKHVEGFTLYELFMIHAFLISEMFV